MTKRKDLRLTVQLIGKVNIFTMIVSKYRIDANTKYFFLPLLPLPSPVSLLLVLQEEKSIFEKKPDDFHLLAHFILQAGIKFLARYINPFLAPLHWSW